MGHYSGNSYNGEWIEITVRDGSGRKLETFKFNVNDKAMSSRIIELVLNKYDIKLNSIRIEKKDRDIDFLNKDTDF